MKKEFAIKLVKKGLTNAVISKKVLAKFKSGLSPVTLTQIRKEVSGSAKGSSSAKSGSSAKSVKKTPARKNSKIIAPKKQVEKKRKTKGPSKKAEAKKQLATEMLQQGASNIEILRAIKKQFNSGMAQTVITGLRKELNIPGKKGKPAGKKSKDKNKTALSSNSQAKQILAIEMLQQGASNIEILKEIKNQFNSGLAQIVITDLRKKLNIPGKKGRRIGSSQQKTATNTFSPTPSLKKSEAKKELTIQLLKQGASNIEILRQIKKQYNSGMAQTVITQLRKELNIPGKKGKRAGSSAQKRVAAKRLYPTPNLKKSEAKKELTIQLLKQGASNIEILRQIKKQYNSGMAQTVISQLRKELSIPGKKGRGAYKDSASPFSTDSLPKTGTLTKRDSSNLYRVTWKANGSWHEKGFNTENQLQNFMVNLTSTGVSIDDIDGWKKLDKRVQIVFADF